MMELDPQVASAIRDRVQLMREWLAEQARCVADQRDFERSTPECTFWHFGYQAALQDILDYVVPHADAAADDSIEIHAVG